MIEQRVNEMIDLGRNIAKSDPGFRQLSFEISELSKPELERIAEKYNAPLMVPNLMYNHYRTTVLDGCTKIVLRSHAYNVKYQISEI